MKNIIKSFAVAVAMLLSTSVLAEGDASYLYWMTENLGSFGGAAWTYAQVKYDSGSGTGYLAYGGTATQFDKVLTLAGDFYAMQVAIGSLTLGDSYKFALELFNSSGDVVGSSAWLAYDAGFIGGKSMSAKEAVFSGFQIPEPTSGLLMMMGFGVLALRRKQKKA